MRVLVVDQDSASNLAITRALRELYSVDCVTNKGDCLDLLRANTYEVIVATERLEDGSGLELLGTISKKWSSVLRIFAAERQRLQLLRGRLGPFQLFQTLAYPIDPERLIATLEVAEAAQNTHADTSDIQQIELSGEAPAEKPEADAPAESEGSLEVAESEDFPTPRPAARTASIEQAQVASGGRRTPSRNVSAPPSRSAPGPRPRGNGAAGPPTTRSGSGSSGGRGVASTVRGSTSGVSSGARSAASLGRDIDAPPTFAGSGTIGPRGGTGAAASARASRQSRSAGATNKAPPVRFPPLERNPPLEPPQESSSKRSGGDSFAEAAAMARAARSNYESTSEEFETKRLAVMVGGGLAVVLAVVFLGVKMFSSKGDALKATVPAAAHAPQYPQEVTDLVAQTEEAFKADDFKTARADIAKLRQLSPSHPRLGFFEGLLTAKADMAAKGGAGNSPAARGGSKKNAKSSPAGTSPSSPSKVDPEPALASAGAAPSGHSSAAPSTPDGSSQGTPAFQPETPVGLSRASTAAGDTGSGTVAAGTGGAAAEAGSTSGSSAAQGLASASGGGAAPGAGSTSGPSAVKGLASASGGSSATGSGAPATSAPTSSQSSASSHRGSGEPPPVIQEAKLIRRVNPDYPSAAKKEGIAGSVDLEVTVSTQGVVEDVSIVQATPPDMFDKSALAAVRKWKYDPRFVDGLPSQAHLKVHLDFGPNK
jgi:TonB family protein